MTVARLFREAREAAGLSQEALARRAGVSSSTVIRIEGAKLKPLASTLFAMADALDIPYDNLRTAVAQSEALDETDDERQERHAAAVDHALEEAATP